MRAGRVGRASRAVRGPIRMVVDHHGPRGRGRGPRWMRRKEAAVPGQVTGDLAGCRVRTADGLPVGHLDADGTGRCRPLRHGVRARTRLPSARPARGT